MNEQDYKVVEAMETYGGSFVRALAECCRHAARTNLAKIKATWPEYWQEYTKMADARIQVAVREAEENHKETKQ